MTASGPPAQITRWPSTGRNAPAIRDMLAESEAHHAVAAHASPTETTAAARSANVPACPPAPTGTKCRANPASTTDLTTSGSS